jgi:hypothetical protein
VGPRRYRRRNSVAPRSRGSAAWRHRGGRGRPSRGGDGRLVDSGPGTLAVGFKSHGRWAREGSRGSSFVHSIRRSRALLVPRRTHRPASVMRASGRGGQAARLLGPVGCGGRPPCTPGLSTWSSSRSLRTPEGTGNLVSERASRLDAFSAYPFPTWLPGGAPSGTAGTPEVGPPQSSRTRGDPPQVSHAHGR